MGPTQAAALVMQEQAKAEATRVASLRARGIAADPRPAMEMAEVKQFLHVMNPVGLTVGSVFFISDGVLIGAAGLAELHVWALSRVAIEYC